MLHNKTSSSEFDLKEVGAQPALAPSVALVLFLHRPLVGVVFISVVDLEALLDDARKERERRFKARSSKSAREQFFSHRVCPFVLLTQQPRDRISALPKFNGIDFLEPFRAFQAQFVSAGLIALNG